LAFDLGLDELVVDPTPAMAHDLVTRLHDGPGRLGMSFERHRDREHADLDLTLREDAHQSPEADAAAVLVHRFDLHVAHALERRHAWHFLQERFGLLVAVQDRALAALLVVHDDLHREAGPPGPLRIRRMLAVADEVPRVRHAPAAS